MAGKGRKRRTVLFVFELILLAVLLGGLYVYGQINSRLGNLQTKELDPDKVQVNDLVSTKDLSGYTNIALFGVDSRESGESSYVNSRSDTMIIASINNDTKEVRLCSVYRDSMLVVGQTSDGEDRYQKCNESYALGGVEQAISMINTNMDLNITEYVAVDMSALATVVDALGGLDLTLTGAEIIHMNNYCVETSEITGKTYTPVEELESDDALAPCHLNGVQATSYARIRYTAGLDFERTERQRIVIQKIVEKAKKAGLTTLTKIMDEVFPMVQTSLSKEEIFNMGAGMLSYDFGETTGFPFKHYEATLPNKGSVVIPTTLEYNVRKLHEFLYGDTDYQVSDTVQKRSDVIISISGYGYNEELDEITKQ